MKKIVLLLTISLLFCVESIAQIKLSGSVQDALTGETLIGANVIQKNTKNGTTTDLDGFFEIKVDQLPAVLEVSYIGYKNIDVNVTENKNIKVKLSPDQEVLSEVVLTDNRLTKRQKQSPITVEALDVIAIKETPAASFYEGLGALKGVDLTSASLGFKIINTRGFNSTSPVRSLQLIDGVDNQSPGLNFALGNFLGSSELDVRQVEIIVGANSALYGPSAFNGVISMQTKSPFQFPGFSSQVKGGERNLKEVAVRYAHLFPGKGDEESKWALKLNVQAMEADDWEATNLSQSFDTETAMTNFGGYDAVNRYGDESSASFENFLLYPGLGNIHRTGYEESDVVDYDTRNLKVGTSLHRRFNNDAELVYGFNYGYGTTVYQGDNRFSLKDLQFYQHKLEYAKKDEFFVRLYLTSEDAGNSYDAVATAVALQDRALSDGEWNKAYSNYWSSDVQPLIEGLEGWREWKFGEDLVAWQEEMQAILAKPENQELLQGWHEDARNFSDAQISALGFSYLVPGTPEFQEEFDKITSQTRWDSNGETLLGGTRFFDKSALYHAQAEHKFYPEFANVTAGANVRLYRPDSNGSIFDDAGDKTIENREFGVYGGVEKKFNSETITASVTMRVDKNENFDYLFSPAASVVYTPNEKDVIRASFSSAIRNPTLTDQYLNFNLGSAILLGNLDGYGFQENFVNTDSLTSYFRGDNALGTVNPDALLGGFLQVESIRPERVRTIELGYRTTLLEKLFVDASVYYSVYTDFIGFQEGVTFQYNSTRTATEEDVDKGWASEVGEEIGNYADILLPSITGVRVSANAKGNVSTQGFSIGLNYYLDNHYTINGNYSYNELIVSDSKDPIIPGFNTPKHKFNIGLTGRDFKNWGFSVNYKWIQGFLFEGSPQFTGFIPTYDLLDAQVNKFIPSIHSTIKVGASNLLDQKSFQVYGGPRVGRLAYISILTDLNN